MYQTLYLHAFAKELLSKSTTDFHPRNQCYITITITKSKVIPAIHLAATAYS